MGKGKLKKWRENSDLNNVFEPPLQEVIDGQEFYKGTWNSEVFGNNGPIVLELGCGKGEYTVGQARLMPEKNFVGVDIKGHRFWRGAKTANEEALQNVAFLRTRIEFIDRFFGANEVSEVWLTFSDPQPKDEKGTKRITSPIFVERYKKFLKPGSKVRIKTDSPLVYEWTLEQYIEKGYNILLKSDDVYGGFLETVDPMLKQLLEIKTYYERMWLEEGRKIHYLEIEV